MDVVKLDPNTYFGKEIVNGWTNMVWSERYLSAGEFELRTPQVEYTRNLIPEDSLISLRDSKEVMSVETLEIETNDDGLDELRVTGRTVEATLLENRVMQFAPYRQSRKLQGNSGFYSALEAAAAITYDMIVNTASQSVLVYPPYGNDPAGAIPNVSIDVSGDSYQNPKEWWVENSDAYKAVTDFLVRYGSGVRNIRPPYTPNGGSNGPNAIRVLSSGTIETVDPNTTTNMLHIDFYNGVDRSEGQSLVTPVVFDWRLNHLKGQRYLFSNKNLRNIGHVKSSIGSVIVYADYDVSPYLTSWARRSMLIDGGDQGDTEFFEFMQGLIQKGEIELAKHNRIAAMETGVQGVAPHKYGRDYNLGDFVTLRGNYGFNQKMQVTEYVRTSDGNIEEGYPTLNLPTTIVE